MKIEKTLVQVNENSVSMYIDIHSPQELPLTSAIVKAAIKKTIEDIKDFPPRAWVIGFDPTIGFLRYQRMLWQAKNTKLRRCRLSRAARRRRN